MYEQLLEIRKRDSMMKHTVLKLDLKKWNETEFGNVSFKKQALWSKLNDLDAKEETHSLSDEEKLDQTNLRSDIKKLTLMEETSWRQKPRVLHLKEGDANTRFFHRMANSNRKIMPSKALCLMVLCRRIRV